MSVKDYYENVESIRLCVDRLKHLQKGIVDTVVLPLLAESVARLEYFATRLENQFEYRTEKSLDPCADGHNYQPRYNEILSEVITRRGQPELDKAYHNRIYQCDVCTKCGKVINCED